MGYAESGSDDSSYDGSRSDSSSYDSDSAETSKWDVVGIINEKIVCDHLSAERQYILSRRDVVNDPRDWRNADLQDSTDVPTSVITEWRAQNPLLSIKWAFCGHQLKQTKKTEIKNSFATHVNTGGDWMSWKEQYNAKQSHKRSKKQLAASA